MKKCHYYITICNCLENYYFYYRKCREKERCNWNNYILAFILNEWRQMAASYVLFEVCVSSYRYFEVCCIHKYFCKDAFFNFNCVLSLIFIRWNVVVFYFCRFIRISVSVVTLQYGKTLRVLVCFLPTRWRHQIKFV